MSQHPDHPLVQAYLDDLDDLLRGLDPQETAEILGGVREHLDGLLPGGGSASDAEVRAALAELGPAAAVADEAYAGRAPAAAAVAPSRVPVLSRVWLPGVAAVLQVLALFLLVLTFGAVAGGTTGTGSSAVTVTNTATGETSTQVSSSAATFDPGSLVEGAGASFFATFLFWVPLLVLVMLCALWTGREKAVLMALTPLAAAVLAGVPLAVGLAVGAGPVQVATIIALVLVVAGVPAALVVLWRRALRRSVGLSSGMTGAGDKPIFQPRPS